MSKNTQIVLTEAEAAIVEEFIGKLIAGEKPSVDAELEACRADVRDRVRPLLETAEVMIDWRDTLLPGERRQLVEQAEQGTFAERFLRKIREQGDSASIEMLDSQAAFVHNALFPDYSNEFREAIESDLTQDSEGEATSNEDGEGNKPENGARDEGSN